MIWCCWNISKSNFQNIHKTIPFPWRTPHRFVDNHGMRISAIIESSAQEKRQACMDSQTEEVKINASTIISPKIVGPLSFVCKIFSIWVKWSCPNLEVCPKACCHSSPKNDHASVFEIQAIFKSESWSRKKAWKQCQLCRFSFGRVNYSQLSVSNQFSDFFSHVWIVHSTDLHDAPSSFETRAEAGQWAVLVAQVKGGQPTLGLMLPTSNAGKQVLNWEWANRRKSLAQLIMPSSS